MDKVFKVEITNGEPNGYLSATFLDLPASENEYIQAQIQAKVANSEKMETEVLQVYQGSVTTDMVDGTPFSELNTLAAVLSQLDNTQEFALEGMLKIRQEATGVQEIPISDILHMADNTDRCMVATHIWDHLALGHLLYETEVGTGKALHPLGENSPEAAGVRDRVHTQLHCPGGQFPDAGADPRHSGCGESA